MFDTNNSAMSLRIYSYDANFLLNVINTSYHVDYKQYQLDLI